MRIAVVGPTHPFKGGIAQHTTYLAHELRRAGHEVQVVSWKSQYPDLLYPGVQPVSGEPELPVFGATRRRLHWARPWTWLGEGRRLGAADLVVLAHVTPVQVPPYWLMLWAARSARRRGRIVVICHNVLPHEHTVLQRPLVRALLGRADAVVTHSAEQAEVARELTDVPVAMVPLAPFAPPHASRVDVHSPRVHRRLLFFGLVRPYKGLDVLLQALADGPPDVQLRVVGEFWGGVDAYVEQCRSLGISHRVELVPGYVAAEDVPAHFAGVDALVLPYRSATGSQAPLTAFGFGLPVITSDAEALAARVTPGVDGLVVPAGDAAALADAITTFYTADRALELRAGVDRVDHVAMWSDYLRALGAGS